MQEFRDRVAVVTGAASGIGRALAERFAAAGMKVVLADVEQGALAAAERALASSGARVLAVPTDVSKASDVEALAQRTLEAFGAVHVVCNNAGVSVGGLAWEVTLADWEWILGVNLWGVIHGIRTFVPILLRQGEEGHVVNTASMAGLLSGPGIAPYNVTKHAVVTLSEALHHELAVASGGKVKVSVLCPGWVNTRILDADRNRPASLGAATPVRPELTAVREQVRQLLQSGLAPAAVAEHVFAAVRDGRFYILTHPQWKPAIRTRLEDILEERPPTLRVMA
jgi:NAD(P)-dependent dehydrogenase (short-subunit alcohol dehydrogenase family)